MFILVAKDKGIKVSGYSVAEAYRKIEFEPKVMEADIYINLSSARFIKLGAGRSGPSITFCMPATEHVVLHFEGDELQGEYQRILRIIEENTGK